MEVTIILGLECLVNKHLIFTFAVWPIDGIEILHKDKVACMFMNLNRTQGKGGVYV